MKILQITSHFSPNIGGVETHLTDLTSELVRRGNTVSVITYRPLTTKVKWKMFEKKGSITIFRIPWLPGFFYRFVKNPFLEFLYLAPALFLFIPFAVVATNPKVIHSHGLIAGFGSVFWGRIFGKRVISTTHSIYHFPKSGLYRNFAAWVFRNSDKVLTLSKQSRDEIVNLGINKNKVRVFTYWVDLDRFKKIEGAKKKLGWEDKFVVLFVGRLIPEKGVRELLAAVRSWDKKITLAVAGTGPMEEEIKNLKLKIENLIYLGKIDNDKLPLYYSASDLLIVPSVHEEGFGRVILEALACGTPVVGANRGAIPEAMDNSVGKLLDVSPENIKNSVENFYDNPGKLEKLSRNTRAFAAKMYSEKNVETIIKAYR